MYQLPAEWRPLRLFGAWEKIKSRPARVRNPRSEPYPLFSNALWASLPMMCHSIFGGDNTLSNDELS